MEDSDSLRTAESSTRPSRAASAVDIPVERADQRRPDNRILDSIPNLRNFVGSPEQLRGSDNDIDTRVPRTALLGSNSELLVHSRHGTERPSLGNRSVSTPHHLPTVRRRANTTTHRPNRFSRTHTYTPREPQWSIFGQAMENEGQLVTPMAAAQRRSIRKSQAVTSDTASTPVNQSSDDPFRTPEVQSPVTQGFQDPFRDPAPSDSESESEESDSDSEEVSSSSSSATLIAQQETTKWWRYIPDKLSTTPVLYRNLFKCALAYFLASLFTYNDYLSSFIADLTTYGPGSEERVPLPSGHMVATVAVYFHPGRTFGAMVDADLFWFFGLFYAAFVSLSSIGLYTWLEEQELNLLGDMLAIFWLGICVTWLAWMKIWMGNPQFGTACSMVSIIIFVVVVKEGGLKTLLQVTFIVSCGCATSNLVCWFVWPSSATVQLQTNMTKTLDSFSTLLNILTNTFLLEEGGPRLDKIQRATENHQSSFTGLKKNLKEAKREWYLSFWGGRKKRDAAYEDALDSLTRLGQHLNGLRSGTRLQYELTKAGVVNRKGRKGKKGIAEVEKEDEETLMLKAAASMFGDLVDDLGPPLKALTSTCAFSLKRLRESFVQSHSRAHRRRRQDLMQPQEFHELVEGIEKSLVRFESTSNHAVLRLYRRSTPSFFSDSTSGDMRLSARPTSSDVHPSESFPASQMENSMLMAADNEHVFLVYFFIFTLQEFSRELVLLVDAMERVYTIEQTSVRWGGLWAKFWTSWRETDWKRLWKWERKTKDSRLKDHLKPKPSLQRKLSAYMKQESPDHPRPFFPKVQPHAPNTMQTPPRRDLSFLGRVKQSIWAVGKRLSNRDAKHAIRTGMGLAILAAPAFFDSTRRLFLDWGGDWALISFFVVISPTVGATNFMAVHRVLGTLLGAVVAATIYTLFPENAPVLSIFGFFFSIPCFYLIVGKPTYASPGRFILLTYNLTCLYCYNKRQLDLPVVFVAQHRAIAVTVGVLWAAIVSRFWWPAEARRELSKMLSEFCLNIGWLYTRLVASNSFSPVYNQEEDITVSPTEHTSLLSPANTRLNNSIQEFMAMELHLQIKLIELQGLLAQTQHEPRLKGPFPVQLYRGILASLQTILDRLHSMRCVTTREEWYTSVRKDFIIPVNRERRDMVGNIILYFSTLSSAFRLKAPLPPYLPPAERSRQRLVEAIRQLDVVRNRDVRGSRQLLFFAYALTMKGVTDELENLGKTLQSAFGVIGQSAEEFEALFVDTERRLTVH